MTDFRALCEELMNEAIYLGELPYEQDMNPELLARVQAALAQPEPEVLADEEWEALKDRLLDRHKTVGYQGEVFIYDRDFDVALDDVRQELDRYARPAIKPVPVSERLPGPEDCDEEGRCWLRGNVEGDWRLVDPSNTGVPQLKYCFSHWLPRHALPVPLP